MSNHSTHVALALDAINAFVREKRIIEPTEDVCAELCDQAGVFVSLKKFGELRGCIGTIEATQPSIAYEIVHNAISAATRDPRFLPVEPDEIPHLTCSVDVLMPPEPVDCISKLDPVRYGVIVECDMRRGLLLPSLEGVETIEEQVNIACKKAMISPREPFRIYRFEVKRFY